METNHIEKIRESLAAQEKYHEPWTFGVVNLSGSEQTLFFKCDDDVSRSINLGSCKEKDIEHLIAASVQAIPENVSDETNRKAWTLDEGSFSWLFNPDSGKFIAQLARGLCPWDNFSKGIKAEPYKLNVYGQGNLFKVDEPGAEYKFGSLVFVLPFVHSGGNLVLRHRGRELNFDAPTLLQDTQHPSAAYVAFYNDVEHETLEITSGHRVSVTFNLCYDPTRAPPIRPRGKIRVPENSFITSLRNAFRDAAFIRNHKYLGFGLEYEYPKEIGERFNDRDFDLKGPDAFVYRILAQLGLKPSIQNLYSSHNSGECDFWVMNTDAIGRCRQEADDYTELQHLLESDPSACIVWCPGKSEKEGMGWHPWYESYFEDVESYRKRTVKVDWVTLPTDNLVALTDPDEAGDEPAVELFSYQVCIIIDVDEVPCPPLPK